jgi:uncharacterized protein involved in high-affinity Fe2+ transport
VLNLVGPGTFVDAGPLTNNGTVNWQGGTVYVENNNTSGYMGGIWNQSGAQWNIQCSQSVQNYFETGYEIFHNAGLLLKNGVSGTSTFLTHLDNDIGTVAVEIGTISLAGGYTLGAGGTLDFGLNSLTSFGQINLPNTAPLGGALRAHLNNGYVPFLNDAFTILSYNAYTNGFDHTNLPPVAVWQTTFGASSLTVKVLMYVPQLAWPAPADIIYGAALTSSQLDAAAASPTNLSGTLAGTFVYTPPMGTVLDAGSNSTLSVTFTPTDTTTYTNATLAVTIGVQKAPLTITANNQSKAYGAALPALTVGYSGFVNGDSTASLMALPALTTTAEASSAVGTYPITPSGAAGANYAMSYVSATLTVTPVGLTITANNQSKAYGAALPALTVGYSGFVNGDSAASLTTLPALTTTATASSAVGKYPITPSGGLDPNYAMSYVSATLTVTPVGLTITANNQSKAYGAALPALTVGYSGFVNGDSAASLTMLPALTTTGTASSAVGTYPIMPSGAVDANYTITYVNGSLTVNKAVLTITASSTTKLAGETVKFAGTEFTAAGLQNSETVELVTLTSAGAPASAPAGTYSIVASAPTGGTFSPGNYTDVFVNGTLTVLTPPSLTLTVNGDQYELTFQTEPGQIYQLQYKTEVTITGWASLGGPITGTGSKMSLPITIAAPQSFFRLQIAP